MLNDPMLIAEMIAEKRDAEDAKWRAQMEDLKAREAWHNGAAGGFPHDLPFPKCQQAVCRGDRPVPR